MQHTRAVRKYRDCFYLRTIRSAAVFVVLSVRTHVLKIGRKLAINRDISQLIRSKYIDETLCIGLDHATLTIGISLIKVGATVAV